MKRNIKALLCATALIGTMSFVPLKAEVIDSPMEIDSPTSYNDNLSVEAAVTINGAGGMSDVNKLTNKSIITNNGTGGIVAQSIENSLSTSKIEGSGNLTFAGTSSNAGVISQGIVNITGGTFSNTNSLTAGTLNLSNNAKVTGANGTTVVSGGDFAAGTSLSQKNVDVQGNLTNNGTITATNDFQNGSGVKITAEDGKGTLNINNGGSNAGEINQNSVSVSGGTFSNTNKLTAGTLNLSNGAKVTGDDGTTVLSGGELEAGTSLEQKNVEVQGNITNNGTITATNDFQNGSGVKITADDGKGTLNINNGGSNAGEITQNEVNVTGGNFSNTNKLTAGTLNLSNGAKVTGDNGITVISGGEFEAGTSLEQKNVEVQGDLENDGTITVTNMFTNAKNKQLTGDGSLSITDATGLSKNEGTIEQASVSIAGTKFTNDGTIETVADTATGKTGAFTNNATELVNNKTITAGGTFINTGTITGSGSLSVKDGSNTGSIAQAITNSGIFENRTGGIISGAVTNQGTQFTNSSTITGNISNTSGTFTNNGTLGQAPTDANGNTTISVNITNSGSGVKFTNSSDSVIAGTVQNTNGAIFTNNSTNAIKIATLNNYSTVDGAGEVEIGSGSNTGSIEQEKITYTGTYNNTGSIESEVTNTGTFTNDKANGKTGTILGKITNSNIFTNKGNIGKVTNPDGTVTTQKEDISNSGTFTNAAGASIIASTIENKNTTGGTAAFTNNATIQAATFNNSGTVLGTGSLEVAGGTNDSGKNFTQGIIHFIGDYTNDGNMNITKEFTNDSGKNLTGDGSLSITDATGLSKNEGTIEQASVSIAGTKFTNDGTIETVADTATGKTGAFTNNATELVNNKTITAGGIFTNKSKISGSKGTLNINNGGNSSGEITQKDINISSNFENKAMLKTVGSVAEDGSKINGTLTNDGIITNSSQIIADVIQNNDNAEINGGTIEIGGGTNDGAISVTLAKVTGDFANDKDLTTATLENNSDITGNGNLKVTDGSKNTGNISQDQVEVVTRLSVASEKSLTAKTLSNGGTITNTNGTMSIENITSNNTIELKDEASLSVSQQTNTLAGWIKSLGNGKTNTFSVRKAASGSNDITGKLSALEGSTLVLEDGNVVDSAEVEVIKGSTLDLQGTSKAVINNNDNWAGTITTNGGSLTVQDRNSNGALIANTGAVTLETGKLQITSGSIIKDAVTAQLKSGTTLEILNGGKVTLNSGDTWASDVLDAEGNVTTKGATIILGEAVGEAGSKVDISDANQLQAIIDDIKAGNELPENLTILNVDGLDSTGTLKGNNGVLLLGDKNLDVYGESYIATAVAMQLKGNIKVSNGGSVSIDNNDIMSGDEPTVTLSEGGTLNYGRTEDAGLKIDATAGNLNLLGGSNLTFNSGSIADEVAIDIQKDATLTVSASTLNLDNKDHWNGNIVNTDGIINANNISRSDTATLRQSGGVLNLYNNTDLVLGSESSITNGEINITKDFTITDAETGEDKEIIGTKGSRLTITSGYDKDSQVIKGGNMTIDKDSEFVVKSGTFTLDSLQAYGEKDEKGVVQAALVNTMNGERNTSTIGNLSSDSIVNFNIDIHARTNNIRSNDQFIIGSMGDGTINIDKWALNGDIYGWDAPIDRHIKLGNIFMSEDGSPILNPNIITTDYEVFTPIGWYKLNKNDIYKNIYENGVITGRNLVGANYTLDLTRFNPQVFRGQVATVAQWMNQLSIDEMLFNHTMLMPSFKEENGNKPSQAMANQYSAINPLFSPYQYSVKDGGLWYKMYGTFEHLNMNNGLSRVGNNAYGALIGADYGLKTLKNGWKFMPTTYIGYNGAYQYWSGMGQYQNGGQAGLMGTWYKDDFIISSILYGGLYDNSMTVHGHNENTLNYFAGSATKAAYNWRFHRDWILQPNLMASYNYFGQQNWHSDFGQMGMMAGMLHGVNIAPGVNLIWEKETFSTYLTLQYLYNINGASGGKAGNVGLPQVEMDRGFIQYGIGFTKKFTDRVSGYLQAVLRNVGRTGVGFQAGFNVKLGK